MKTTLLFAALALFTGTIEAHAQARGLRGVIGGGLRNTFATARTAIVGCIGYDALNQGQQRPQQQQHQQQQPGSPTGQQRGCVQTVVNSLQEAVNGITPVVNGGLDAWCNAVNDMDGSIQECNSLKATLGEQRVQTMLREARPNEFLQQVRARANSLQGNAQVAACRRQSRQMRECLLAIEAAFSGGNNGQQQVAGEPRQTQPQPQAR